MEIAVELEMCALLDATGLQKGSLRLRISASVVAPLNLEYLMGLML